MTCGQCKEATLVTDSRPSPGGLWRRRHRCPNGHRFTTYEHLASENNINHGRRRSLPALQRGHTLYWRYLDGLSMKRGEHDIARDYAELLRLQWPSQKARQRLVGLARRAPLTQLRMEAVG